MRRENLTQLLNPFGVKTPRGASWDECPCRIASSPILTIVPLIIRRLRGPSPVHILAVLTDAPRPSRRYASLRRGRLERRPQKARQLARDRHRYLRRRFLLFGQASESSAQSLLRFIGDRDHAGGLSFPPPRQRDADTGPMLVVPGRFDQQPADQRVAGSRDAAAPMLLPA